jgi:hypothetical protein
MGSRVSFAELLSPEEQLAVKRAAPSHFIRSGAVNSPAIPPASQIVYALDEAVRGGLGAIAHPDSETRNL